MNAAPRKALAGIAMIWLGVAAPLAAGADSKAAAAAIRAHSAALLKAYNAGDADAVMAQFDATAVVMPPGVAPLRGTAEIRTFVEKDIANWTANRITLALGSGDEVGASDDVAWHSGPYSLSKDGTTIDSGKYLEAWRKSGGHWRLVRRMWNSNEPPPATTPAPKPARRRK